MTRQIPDLGERFKISKSDIDVNLYNFPEVLDNLLNEKKDLIVNISGFESIVEEFIQQGPKKKKLLKDLTKTGFFKRNQKLKDKMG